MKIVEPTQILDLSTEVPTFCDTEGGGFYIDLRLIQCYQPEVNKEDVIFYDTDKIDIETIK